MPPGGYAALQRQKQASGGVESLWRKPLTTPLDMFDYSGDMSPPWRKTYITALEEFRGYPNGRVCYIPRVCSLRGTPSGRYG